ncbi:hypothetical protein [Candidatus Magnetaquiglobus chichijimensis]|uniref:hypothetical protein n=1 Tax=Candidatus Magnetaquiglobus chichijimensis TaxID=3141448 RepID=UPI003B97B695
MKKLLAVAAVCVTLSSSAAHAMTGAEFYGIQSHRNSATEYRKLLEPLIMSYVQTGCQNVPDWPELSWKINDLIRLRGLANADASQIAWEAAHGLGMNCAR